MSQHQRGRKATPPSSSDDNNPQSPAFDSDPPGPGKIDLTGRVVGKSVTKGLLSGGKTASFSKYREHGDGNDSDEEEQEKNFNKEKSTKAAGASAENTSHSKDNEVESLIEGVRCQNLNYTMDKVEVSYLYHVTKSKDLLKTIKSKGFLPYEASDENYDGDLTLADAPKCVFFSTTLRQGKLPTLPAYPRAPKGESHQGVKFPRIALKIDDLHLENYELFLVKEPTKPACNKGRSTLQLHVAFIHRKNETAVKWAKTHLRHLDRKNNKFFKLIDGDGWYGLKKEQGTVDIWTNVFLVPAKGDNLLESFKTAKIDYVRHF